MADKFQLVNADFGKDINEEIEKYVHETLEWLERSFRPLHQDTAPKWRRNYMGIPVEAKKNFPWTNASNVVIQVIGEIVDTLAARVLGLLYATHPLWAFNLSSHGQDPQEMEKSRRVLEDFMDRVGYEPEELDLYRVEGDWFIDAAKLGTACVKVSHENITEAVIVGYTENKKQREFTEEKLYEGPRVSNLRFEDVMADPAAHTLDGPTKPAPFVSHRVKLKRRELMERGYLGLYESDKVEAILHSPDRYTESMEQRQESQQAGFANAPSGSDDTTAEWDIYECYFGWWAGSPRRKYRLIFTYHKKTKTVLRRVFNFLPKHKLPILMSRVGHRGTGLLGHGFGEMFEGYQDSVTTTVNQRTDNASIANVRALRISPRLRNLDASFELYPSALIVAEKDEVEALQVGDVYPSSFENEQAMLSRVAARAGIEPAISGMGTGGMSRKPAVYSSLGTMAVMQEGNSRVNLQVSDFRHAHLRLGSLLALLYAKYGTAGREKAFGLDASLLVKALGMFEKSQLSIPIRASTASVNREVEKQNDMILVGLLQRYHQATAQLLQAMNSPMTPPEVGKYLLDTVRSMHAFMRRVLKDFGYDEPDAYLPEPQAQSQGGAPGQAGPGGPGGQMAPGGQPMGAAAGASPGGASPLAGAPGSAILPGLLAPPPR